MKSIKVDEATGTTLDWAVAKALGVPVEVTASSPPVVRLTNPRDMFEVGVRSWAFTPTTHWAQGGPIIERENISLASQSTRWAEFWQADIGHSSKFTQWDHKPLIAAMRCYVMSKLGETVEVPEELLNASHLTN